MVLSLKGVTSTRVLSIVALRVLPENWGERGFGLQLLNSFGGSNESIA